MKSVGVDLLWAQGVHASDNVIIEVIIQSYRRIGHLILRMLIY